MEFIFIYQTNKWTGQGQNDSKSLKIYTKERK
jgi:hypothetical protein